jgi:hypothetical protein
MNFVDWMDYLHDLEMVHFFYNESAEGTMTDTVGMPTGNIGSGSALLLADTTVLAGAADRDSAVIDTTMISTIGVDISADQDCLLTVTRLPDGENAGAAAIYEVIPAGTPRFVLCRDLMCPAVIVTVENQSASAMTAFSLYVRGAA